MYYQYSKQEFSIYVFYQYSKQEFAIYVFYSFNSIIFPYNLLISTTVNYSDWNPHFFTNIRPHHSAINSQV